MLRTGADFLPQIQVQQIEDPARCGTERTDDDRATAGQQVRQGSQRPRSAAVEERQPGQVQDKPLGPLIDDLCRVHQEPRNRENVKVTTQGEHVYPAVTNDLDSLWDTVVYRGPIVQTGVSAGAGLET